MIDAGPTMVAGATSFVERALTQQLVECGASVRILARHVGRARRILPESVGSFEGDRDLLNLQSAWISRQPIYMTPHDHSVSPKGRRSWI